MNLALTVLEIVAPVFLLAGFGFGWIKLGFEYRLQFVTRLAVNVAVPCLIFVALMETQIPRAELGRFAVAGFAGHFAIIGAMAVLVRVARLDRQTFQAPMIFGNTGNLGLPLAMFAFGQAGLGYAVVMLGISTILSFSYGIYLVAGRGAFVRILKEPLVWSTALGALFLWQGWQTPTFLTNTLKLAGQMAVPLMLLTLGVAVASLVADKILQAVALSVVKLVICASIGWGIGELLALDPIAFGVLVLQLSTPVAVTSYLLAEKYGADGPAVAGLVMASTALSVISLPLLLALLL
ncbi:MAG: AEC family transporter [Paracoccaceae bacterium]